MLSAEDRRTVLVCARVAARHGLPITACPWRNGDDDRHRALWFLWGRTYARLRPDLCGQALDDGDPGVLSVTWDAYAQGRDAARAGEPLTACPYRPDAPTAVEREQYRMWCRGYDTVNPFPIDYTG
ncbi:MAG: hypothetical protein IRY90_19230 [Actinomadura rubrobrunea]|nr:hypothetical protein [Actinomadura rubrobrunea]